MRTIILAATAVLALAGSASAQVITAPGQFCLRTTGGTNQGMETCAYQTMAQCNAAKSGSDTCIPNPSMKGAGTATTGSSGKSKTGSAPKSLAGSASKSTTGAAPRQ